MKLKKSEGIMERTTAREGFYRVIFLRQEKMFTKSELDKIST